MFDRFVKFHISLPTAGLDFSFCHLLMDLRGKKKNHYFWGDQHFLGGPTFWGQKTIFSKKCLDRIFLGIAETARSACAMGKRGPPLAYTIFAIFKIFTMSIQDRLVKTLLDSQTCEDKKPTFQAG